MPSTMKREGYFMRKNICKQIIFFLCIVSIVMMYGVPASAAEHATDLTQLSPQDVAKAIENGTAEIETRTFDILELTPKEIENDVALQDIMNQLNSASVNAIYNEHTEIGKGYQTTVRMDSGDVLDYYSVPKVTISVGDVPDKGASDVSTIFEVAESVKLNGVLVDEWYNYIIYSDISVKLGCGSKVLFTQTARVTGNDKKGGGSVNFMALFEFALSITKFDKLVDILDFLNDFIVDTDNNDYTTSASPHNSNVIAAKWDSDVDLSEHGAYLRLESSLSKDSITNYDIEAIGVAQWEYNVYFGYPNLSPEDKNVSLYSDVSYLIERDL